MSIRFDKAKAEAKAKIAGLGESRDRFEIFVAKTLLEKYADDFITTLNKYINDRDVVNSGKLASNIGKDIDNNGKRITVTMLDYYDYPNKGVRGVNSNKNAANSPYKFKNYGMNAQGRASIKEMISEGKAKVRDVSKTKRPIGSEKKNKSLIDMQTDTLIYLIKKYGIKKTSYFDDAFKAVFSTLKEDVALALGEDVIIDIKTISKKK